MLVRARTGSGKTLAYALPLLQKILHAKVQGDAESYVRAVVLVPTKDLCQYRVSASTAPSGRGADAASCPATTRKLFAFQSSLAIACECRAVKVDGATSASVELPATVL